MHVRPRVDLSGRQPLVLSAVVVVCAVALLVAHAARPTHVVLAAAAADLDVTSEVAVRAGLRFVVFAGAAWAMRWRARRARAESLVWTWFARAGWVAASTAAIGGAVEVLGIRQVIDVPGASSLVLTAGVLTACPLLYQGLVHWNRYQTSTSQPGDWLNGLGAVFAVTAVGNVVLVSTDSPIAGWQMWQAQLWLLRSSAEAMLLGTAATVMVIGGLLRDPRVRLITGSLLLVVLVDVVATTDEITAAGNGPLSEAGWTVLAAVLAVSAVARVAPPVARPATTTAPTAGSFVVLVVSIGLLAVLGVLHEHVMGAWLSAACAWAGAGALVVALRGVQLTQLLALLVAQRHEALTDDLTQLGNRRALLARVRDAVERGRPVTLMIIDLDAFKQVNDRFGHAVGDELLRRTAALLRTVAGPDAFPARLGGDEFAVLLADGSTDTALSISRSLVKATSAPVQIDGRRLVVRGSIGIASSQDSLTPDELLRDADLAMYRAKGTGGGVAVHDLASAQAASRLALLTEELKMLLRTDDAAGTADPGRLEVHYQPQLDRTGDVVGVEALVRWRNDRLGLVAPDAFLPLVEEHGLMPRLTSEVIRSATQQVQRWRRQGHDLRLAVNLSATCLHHEDLPDLVDQVLQDTGLPAARLVLEVTETSLMTEPALAVRRLSQLAERGVGVSIDDYGTGYSSLAYLDQLPASELKLDRSLTLKVLSSRRTAHIVSGTVDLAHRLGLRIVAEGVETEDMLTALRDLGCDETQGYLHAKPLGVEAMSAWLRARHDSDPRLLASTVTQ